MIRALPILREFLFLGLTAFGGPTAHIGFFRDRFVGKLKWLKDDEFADTLALCQFLPGPASSQLGFAIGWKKAGWLGAFAAWVGFTLPSAILMTLIGIGVANFASAENSGWLTGLQIAVVAVIFKAVWQMAQSLCPDRKTALIALGAAAFMLWNPVSFSQLVVIGVGAIFGLAFLRTNPVGSRTDPVDSQSNPVGSEKTVGIFCLVIFVVLLGFFSVATMRGGMELFASFFAAGSLVFGGGHVVLPLLAESVVGSGWLSEADFMAGYGAAQAMPGPLFTFSNFVGAALDWPGNPWVLSAVALVGVFLPSWLLVLGVMPFWDRLRGIPAMRRALAGTNAAVVGLLGAAFYDPIWTSAIGGTGEVIFLLWVAALLLVLKMPPWLVVIAAAVGGFFVF